MERVDRKNNFSHALVKALKDESIDPEAANEVIVPRGTSPVKQKLKLYELLRRPQVDYADLEPLSGRLAEVANASEELRAEVIEQVEINVKYDGYLEKERDMAEKVTRLENVPLEFEMDYAKLTSLSMEARIKLDKVRPGNAWPSIPDQWGFAIGP